jgi:hypothetical protein
VFGGRCSFTAAMRPMSFPLAAARLAFRLASLRCEGRDNGAKNEQENEEGRGHPGPSRNGRHPLSSTPHGWVKV